MILITGANGHFGTTAINFLLKKGVPANQLLGLVRSEAKGAEIKAKGIGLRIGDYNDYNSLVKAFEGIDKLLLVSASEIENRSQQHENAIKAATAAGVKHIFYTSFERKNESSDSPIAMVAESHLHAEKLIKQSGMTYTIMRNNLYMDALPMFFGDQVLETGIFLPAGNTKGAYVLRSDMAEAAANLITGSGHENKTYFISHPEPVSFDDIAEAISEITGKEVRYTSPDAKTFTDTLAKAGVPEGMIGFSLGFAEGIKQGEFLQEKSDLETILGHKPVSVREFLEGVYGN